jgi:hypothetical protein
LQKTNHNTYGVILVTRAFGLMDIKCYALWTKLCKKLLKNSDWWKWYSESEVWFVMQRHETTFVVSYKPSKRWEDVETNSPLCVHAKWIWHICNHNWEFVNTIRTCISDGEIQ